MPPIKPTPLPTDRSIWPGRMMRSIPRASVAVIESSVARSDRFRALRNCEEAMAKKPQMATSAIAIEKLRMLNGLSFGRPCSASAGRSAGPVRELSIRRS